MRSLRLARLSLLVAVMSTLLSCGGSGSGEGDSIAWVQIQSSTFTSRTNTAPVAKLNGEAFISPDYESHNCIGLACLLALYDDSFPGVEVSWTNDTTGVTGSVLRRYGTLTSFAHEWSASVPVTGGINELRVTAADPAGNTASASITLEYIPPAPTDLRADAGNSQVTLVWSPVSLAAGYRVYWSAAAGEAFAFGNSVDVSAPPWVHDRLSNGSTYYFAVTSLSPVSESAPSPEIAAIAGAASRPTDLIATLVGMDVELTWDDVATATGYTIYWQNESGVTRLTGNAIPGVTSPYLHAGLSGLPYYYVVTAANGLGESLESEEASASPPLPPPPPDGLTAVLGGTGPEIELNWEVVPGAGGYTLQRCQAWTISSPDSCAPSELDCGGTWQGQWDTVEWTSNTASVDRDVERAAYWYRIIASNGWGAGQPSDRVGLCVR